MKIPTCFCLVLSLAAVAAAQTPAAPKAPAPKMTDSTIFDWKDMKAEERPNGERRGAFDNPTVTLGNFECHVTTLKVGETSGAPHSHLTPTMAEEAILLKEGTVEIEINGAKRTVGAGSVIYFAPKDSTALRNVGKTPAVYFVISVKTAAAPAMTK